MIVQQPITTEQVQNLHTGCILTEASVAAFLKFETDKGASANLLRRLKSTIRGLWEFLPEDKQITRQRLLDWRGSLEASGYSSVTVLNHVKYINRYLEFTGHGELRFQKGKAKDIAGATFGYLTAIAPTGARDRGDVVWRFSCRCGGSVELPAARVLRGNTLSCGCLKGAHLKLANKYYDGTSLVQSMTEKVKSDRSASGYVGVAPKRDKWMAHIKYKGVRYSLGCYWNIEDAIKARARAKELVMADARGLLDFYTELEKTFPRLPDKAEDQPRVFPRRVWVTAEAPSAVEGSPSEQEINEN